MAFNEKDPRDLGLKGSKYEHKTIIYSDKSNLLEENVYKYRLQDVAEPLSLIHI